VTLLPFDPFAQSCVPQSDYRSPTTFTYLPIRSSRVLWWSRSIPLSVKGISHLFPCPGTGTGSRPRVFESGYCLSPLFATFFFPLPPCCWGTRPLPSFLPSLSPTRPLSGSRTHVTFVPSPFGVGPPSEFFSIFSTRTVGFSFLSFLSFFFKRSCLLIGADGIFFFFLFGSVMFLRLHPSRVRDPS